MNHKHLTKKKRSLLDNRRRHSQQQKNMQETNVNGITCSDPAELKLEVFVLDLVMDDVTLHKKKNITKTSTKTSTIDDLHKHW